MLDVDRPIPRLSRDDVDDTIEVRPAPKSPVFVIGIAVLRLAGESGKDGLHLHRLDGLALALN